MNSPYLWTCLLCMKGIRYSYGGLGSAGACLTCEILFQMGDPNNKTYIQIPGGFEVVYHKAKFPNRYIFKWENV
jgi:hypothetical protein